MGAVSGFEYTHFNLQSASISPEGAGEPKHGSDRTGGNFGWASKYPSDENFERYGKVNKPGGDHHLFYKGGKVCP